MLWVSIWRPHSLATAVAKTIGRGKYQVPVRKESSHTMVGRHDSVSVWSDHIGSTIETSLVLPIPHICDFFRITTFEMRKTQTGCIDAHVISHVELFESYVIYIYIYYLFIYLIRGYIMPHHTTSKILMLNLILGGFDPWNICRSLGVIILIRWNTCKYFKNHNSVISYHSWYFMIIYQSIYPCISNHSQWVLQNAASSRTAQAPF